MNRLFSSVDAGRWVRGQIHLIDWFQKLAGVSEIFDFWQDAQHLKQEVGTSQRGVA